jgi:dolichol-phosphate mannosyltransferase
MLYVLLPAYNEEDALPLLLPSIRQVIERYRLAGQIIVVNDGSTDRTAEIARAVGVDEVLQHSQNMGLSAALRTGLSHAAQMAQSQDIVVTMDADNTHNPGLIPRMIQRVDEGFDIVVASRFRPGARVVGVPPLRQFLSSAGGWVYRLLLPIHGIRDYTCGYRAYRAAVLQTAFERWGDHFISETGFAAAADILLKLRLLDDVLMTELPLILRYDWKPSASKMQVGSNIIASLRLALRRATGRLD